MPFIALYISSILYAIHCLIGSLGNWQSTGVIHVCSELWVLDTRWVAQFWTYCSLSRTDHGNPYRSALQKSSLDEIKARTSISASFWDRQFRILPYSIMHQSIPPAPSTPPPPPPPRATVGHLPVLSVPGVGHLQILHCLGAGHLTTPGPFPSFWHTRGFLSEYNYTEGFTGKKADWLICQGQD